MGEAMNTSEAGRKPSVIKILLRIVASAFLAATARGQASQPQRSPDALHQFNDSVEALVERVSPSVVQIVVSGYSSTEDTEQGQMSVVIGKHA